MRYIERIINSNKMVFLEISSYDNENDIIEHRFETNIIIGMNLLERLNYFKNVKNLILTSGFIANTTELAFLYQLSELKMLIIDYEETEGCSEYSVDVKWFPNLEYLFSKSSYNFVNISYSKSIKTLVVLHWYQNDLTSLKGTNIDTLCIFGGKLLSLLGIEELPVKVLVISNLKIKSISAIIDLKKLKYLEIENCNKISDIMDMKSNTLEYLCIMGRMHLSNINFVAKMSSLRRVIFDVSIEDGDLNSLVQMEHVIIITDKKNFNIKNNKLPKSNSRYYIEGIPKWRSYFNNRNL